MFYPKLKWFKSLLTTKAVYCKLLCGLVVSIAVIRYHDTSTQDWFLKKLSKKEKTKCQYRGKPQRKLRTKQGNKVLNVFKTFGNKIIRFNQNQNFLVRSRRNRTSIVIMGSWMIVSNGIIKNLAVIYYTFRKIIYEMVG